MPRDYNKERDEFRADDRFVRGEAGHSGRRWLWWGVGMVALFTVAGAGLSYCGMAANVATAPAGVINRTVRPENIIANYEWFRQQYRDIESFGSRIELAKNARDGFMRDVGPRAEWSAEDRYRYAQLNDNLTGLQAQRARMIETYNARTQMANRNLFRGADVPAYIEQPEPIQREERLCVI